MNFTFEKTNDFSVIAGTSYIMDFGEDFAGEGAALIEGKLLTAFGDPYRVSEDEENGFEYIIKATAANGEITYLSVYHAASVHIGGDRDEFTCSAAEALIEYVNSLNPSNFERRRYYMDFGVEISTTLKNGQVYMNSRFLNETEIDDIYSRWINE